MLCESVLGLDLSLTRTGMASADLVAGAILTRALESTRKDHHRLQYLVESIALAADTHDLIAIEGPSFRSHDRGFHDSAGFHWLVRHRMWQMRKPVIIIPPATRMKYATGKGGGKLATKVLVHEATRRLWPKLALKTHDEADALILAAIGARKAGHPFDPNPGIERWCDVNSLRIVVP